MKITIDTKEDSKEEIQKAIRLLQSLVSQTPSSDLPEGENVFGSMFEQPFESSETEEDKAKDFSIKDLETY